MMKSLKRVCGNTTPLLPKSLPKSILRDAFYITRGSGEVRSWGALLGIVNSALNA